MAVYVMGGTVGTVPDEEGRPVAFRVDRDCMVHSRISLLPVTMVGTNTPSVLAYERVSVDTIIANSYEEARTLHMRLKNTPLGPKGLYAQPTVEEKVVALWNTGHSPEGIAMKLHVREGRVRHILTNLGYVGGW